VVESKVEAFPEREFLGEVMKIEPQAVVQQSVTTFPVLSRIDNTEGLLLPGMNADVNIVVHRRPGVLAIRNEAVRTPDDARQVADLLGIGGVDEEASRMLAANAPGDQAEAQGNAETGASPVDPGAANGSRGGDNGGSYASNPDASSRPTNGPSTNGDRSFPAGQRGGDDSGVRSSGGTGNGSRMDMSDPEARQRMREMMERRRAEQEAAARDPWGTAGGRREDAVVFVMAASGALQQRQIVTGVRDWEFTEVLEGLAPGDEVVMLPSTSLLRSQDDLRARFAGRSLMGMGGGRGRR
jgi:HlyD family secretion protein